MTYAIYFESYDPGNAVAQGLFIPRFMLASKECPPTFWFRTISTEHPARVWSHASSTMLYSMTVHGMDEGVSVGMNLDQFEGVSSYMRGMLSSPDWTIRGGLPIFLSNPDKLDLLSDNRLPINVVTMIRTARTLNSWPALPNPVRPGVNYAS